MMVCSIQIFVTNSSNCFYLLFTLIFLPCKFNAVHKQGAKGATAEIHILCLDSKVLGGPSLSDRVPYIYKQNMKGRRGAALTF